MDSFVNPSSASLIQLPSFRNPPSGFPKKLDLNDLDPFTQRTFNDLFLSARALDKPAYYVGLGIASSVNARKYTLYDGVYLTKYIFETCKARGEMMNSQKKAEVLANLHLHGIPSPLDRAPIASVCWMALPCKEIPLKKALNVNMIDPRAQLLISDVLNPECKMNPISEAINLFALFTICNQSQTCQSLKGSILERLKNSKHELGLTEPELTELFQSPPPRDLSTPINNSPFDP